MRLPSAIGFAALTLALLLALSAMASGQPIPCDVTSQCAEPPANPAPPIPTDTGSPWTNLWIWAATALVAALVSFLVGLLSPLRKFIINWLESKQEKP